MASEPKCDFGKEIEIKFEYIQSQLEKLNGRMWTLIWSLATLAGGILIALVVAMIKYV